MRRSLTKNCPKRQRIIIGEELLMLLIIGTIFNVAVLHWRMPEPITHHRTRISLETAIVQLERVIAESDNAHRSMQEDSSQASQRTSTITNSVVLERLKQYLLSARDSSSKTCIVPEMKPRRSEQNYTLLVPFMPSTNTTFYARLLFLNALQWLHDPSVEKIYVFIPPSAGALLKDDSHYGARLLSWNATGRVALKAVEDSISLWPVIQGVQISTQAVLFRNIAADYSHRTPNAETFVGLSDWNQHPGALLLDPCSKPEWDGLVLHEDWLCLLAAAINWDSWGQAMTGLTTLLTAIAPTEFYSTNKHACHP